MGRAFHRKTARARVRVAGVFANDDEIDVLWTLVLQRRFHSRVEFHRTQVDVLVQLEAGLEQDALFEDSGCNVRVADGAQQNSIKFTELFNSAVRQSLPGPFFTLLRYYTLTGPDYQENLWGYLR